MLSTDTKRLLALIVLAGFFMIILALFFVRIPAENLDLVKTFGLTLLGAIATVIGYYFGSSDGSARKTDLLSPPAGGRTVPPLQQSEKENVQ